MSTSDTSPQADERADMWLTSAELASWMSVARLMAQLPWALDAQL
ncbi:hypothetical protein [Streptomyces sp. NBC_00038]|nr:hypothetical protein [Streptomyces sp. NBC_00038]MCX5557251.1 hypothetical protein [Streptomyces sp. NBC_00038]